MTRRMTRMQKQAISIMGTACFLAWFMNRDGFALLRLLPAAMCAMMAVVTWILGTPRERA